MWIVVLLGLCLIGFTAWMNVKIKSTSFYRNQFRYSYENAKKNSHADILALGSTYAQFAFQSIVDFRTKAVNCAMYSRPIMYDYRVLKKNLNVLASGTMVFQFLSPCVLLLDERYEDLTGNHCAVLMPWELNQFDLKKWVKVRCPVLKPCNWKRVFEQQPKLLSLDEKYLSEVGNNSISYNAQMREKAWCEQFGLENLHAAVSDVILQQNIKRNVGYLRKIYHLCRAKQCRLVIVIPPFSKSLNQRVGNEFCDSALYTPLKEIEDQVKIVDFREDERYQEKNELFVDGCFLLNETGSRVFLNDLFKAVISGKESDAKK